MLFTSSWLAGTLFLLACSYLLWYKLLTRNFGYWRKRNIPFIKPQLFFGNFGDVFLYKTHIGEHLGNLYMKMKKHRFFGIFIFSKPVLIITDPNLVKAILVKDFNTFSDRPFDVKEEQQPVTAHMLFFAKNPEWKAIRTLTTPAFTSGKLKAMVPLINESGENLKKYLHKHSNERISLEAKEVCAKYSTDVISSCAFGINSQCFVHEDAKFREVGRKLFGFDLLTAVQQSFTLFAPRAANLLGLKMFHQKSIDFLSETFLRTLEMREKGEQRRNDLIDIIMDIKKKTGFCENYNIGM